MNVRIRGPKGQFTLSGLESGMSLSAFKAAIQEKSGIASHRLEILTGFPPTILQMPDDTSSIQSLGIGNGDSLTVREGNMAAAAEAASGAAEPGSTLAGSNEASIGMDEDEQMAKALAASLQDAGPGAGQAPALQAEHAAERPGGSYSPWPPSARPEAPSARPAGAHDSVAMMDGSAIARRVIESDNSCLFNAVGYVMDGSRTRSQRLREVIADTVRQDPATYTEGFLEKSSSEYQRWIKDAKHWGGAIELSILSRFYGREIAAYDIQTKRVDVYGQADGYQERDLLLYDGLHYDALAQTAFDGAPEELDVTIFRKGAPSFAAVEKAAAQLVEACHEARQFTDTGNFTLRCGVCQIGVKGEKEAVQHAKETGHQSFQEYH